MKRAIIEWTDDALLNANSGGAKWFSEFQGWDPAGKGLSIVGSAMRSDRHGIVGVVVEGDGLPDQCKVYPGSIYVVVGRYYGVEA